MPPRKRAGSHVHRRPEPDAQRGSAVRRALHHQRRLGAYPILTLSNTPEMEIALLDRPDQPALGAGEPSTVTMASAVANAVFDATGVRLRQMPFTPERVRAVLIQSG
jgi:nicotinate dehydrogenase subunit B